MTSEFSDTPGQMRGTKVSYEAGRAHLARLTPKGKRSEVEIPFADAVRDGPKWMALVQRTSFSARPLLCARSCALGAALVSSVKATNVSLAIHVKY